MLHYTLNVCLVIFLEWAAIAYCELHITNSHPTCSSYIQPYLHNIFEYYNTCVCKCIVQNSMCLWLNAAAPCLLNTAIYLTAVDSTNITAMVNNITYQLNTIPINPILLIRLNKFWGVLYSIISFKL
jgi:hypothetical protein